jgi:hypothetical protein
MDDHTGRLTIIASSTMVHQRIKCMICGRPVDHRVVFMTNDARVLHAGCVPDHVKVPIAVLLQAIRRLERMVERSRTNDRELGPQAPGPLPCAAAGTVSGDGSRLSRDRMKSTTWAMASSSGTKLRCWPLR